MTLTIALVLIGAAVALTLIRLLIGPTGFDRLVAADTMAVITTALIVLLAHLFERSIYMDVALVYALIGFVGVVTLARHLGGGS
ncbi:MAG: sodium:proton antiporter [Spirochaetales bacterium]|nr:sodium:proton antiporter [Spirochaetales bacterium]MCF7939444.1 sodium:proton antiporter [Spirochaetales bacterium]